MPEGLKVEAVQASGKAAGSSKGQPSLSQPDLVAETEEIAFTAEGRFLGASLFTGGLMKIPREVKEVKQFIMI